MRTAEQTGQIRHDIDHAACRLTNAWGVAEKAGDTDTAEYLRYLVKSLDELLAALKEDEKP